MKTVIIPKSFYVQSTAKKLYRLEEQLHEKVKECGIEWGRLHRVEESELYSRLIPQAIFDLMNNYSSEVGNAVVHAWQIKGSERASDGSPLS